MRFWARWRATLGGKAGVPRVAIFAAVTAIAVALRLRWERVHEFNFVLGSIGLAAVSFFASQWLIISIAGAATALPMLGLALLSRRPGWVQRHEPLHLFVIFLNRQAGHGEVLALWIALVLWFIPCFLGRVMVITVLCLFVPLLLNDLAMRRLRRKAAGPGASASSALSHREPAESEWEVRSERRYYIYALAWCGLIVLLAVSDRGQVLTLVPVALAIFAADVVRALATYLSDGLEVTLKERTVKLARWADSGFTLVVFTGLGILLFVTLRPAAEAGATDHRQRVRWYDDKALADPGPADLSLFLVSDNQFHELGGSRSGVHLDLVDWLVPVAVRPVELDLLSGATLWHFAAAYKALHEEGKAGHWAHLGDSGDLGCASEVRRFTERYVSQFGDGLAALVPGNHDSTFIGNFVWSPDWPQNCPPPGGPLHKAESNDLLSKASPGATLIGHNRFWGSALARVTQLGTSSGRAVLGVFVDTSDFTTVQLGAAGQQGAISSAQARWLRRELKAHLGAGQPPLVLLFLHHTYDELSFLSQWRLNEIADLAGPGLLGLVSAHTHLAALRPQHLGGRLWWWRGQGKYRVPEMVLGSTTDPPQEAALLQVGTGDKGPWVRLRTLPAVARPGQTCDDSPEAASVPAGECRALVDHLKKKPACQAMFRDLGPPPGTPERLPDEEERRVSLEQRRRGEPPPQEPPKVKTEQQDRARALLQCVCSEMSCGLDASQPYPLDDPRLFEHLDRLNADPGHRKELVCLSWAASVLQGHKKQGWSYAQALLYAFDRSVTFSATDLFARGDDLQQHACAPFPPELAPPAPTR